MSRFSLAKIEDPRFPEGKSGEFDHYEAVPPNVAQTIIEARK